MPEALFEPVLRTLRMSSHVKTPEYTMVADTLTFAEVRLTKSRKADSLTEMFSGYGGTTGSFARAPDR